MTPLRLGAATAAAAATLTLAAMSPAVGATRSIPGTTCTAFPADNWWHADVSQLPVDSRSARRGCRTCRRPASCTRTSGRRTASSRCPYGIPITYVAGSHAKVSVSFQYSSESDHVGYPARVGHQDRGRLARRRRPARDHRRQEHLPRLRDLATTKASTGHWHAGSGATWSLTSDALRPAGWTSADAAGLPILPGLLRYDEVKAGHVDHAIRFTTDVTVDALHLAGAAPGRVDRRAVVPADGRAVPPQGVATPCRATPRRRRSSSRR